MVYNYDNFASSTSKQDGGGGTAANHRGKGKGGTLQPTMPTNKGMVSALGNHVFDYGQGKTAEQLNKNWEKLLSHIGIHYSQDLHAELTTRVSISIPVPDYPPGVEEQHKLSEEKRLSDLDSFISKYTRLLGTVNRQLDNTSLSDIEEEQLVSKQIGLEEKIASLTTSKSTKPPVVLHGKELTAYLSASKNYTNRCDRLTTDRAKVYELIKGQCTPRLMDKLEKESSWISTQQQKDPLKLFSLIEKLTLSHTDDTYYYQAWYDSLYALFNIRCEHSDLEYMKRFDALLRVFQAQGGWFHKNHLDHETTNLPEAAKDGISSYQDLPEEQQEAVQEMIGEKIATYMMLRQSGSRHAALRMDMQNDYTKRIKDAFPANRQELQRKFESLSFSKHVGSQSSHGTAFFQQQQTKEYKKKPRQVGGEYKPASYEKKAYTRPDAHLPPYDRKQWAERICTHCGLKGHPHTHCHKMLRANLAAASGINTSPYTPLPASKSTVSSMTGNTACLTIQGSIPTNNHLSFLQTVATTTNSIPAYQDDLALRDVILLDSQSTMDLFCNKDMVTSIYTSTEPCMLQSNAGKMLISHKAVVPGLKKDVWFDTNALSNIVALRTLKEQYRVTYDSAQGSCFIVHRQDANGMPNMVFHMHPSGLHYYDPGATSNFTFLTTVEENKDGVSQRQIQGAERARDLYSKLAYPSLTDFKWMVQSNSIQDCPVTLNDIVLAEKIWGPNIAALKGKTTRSTPKPVTTDYLQVPKGILDLHKEVYLTADIFFVNQVPFLLTYSRHLCFTTVTHLSDRKIQTIVSAYGEVHQLYHRRGFHINTLALDGEFAPAQGLLQALPHGPRVNLTSANEHVPEAERRICTLKERVRSLRHSLPYTKLPPIMLTHMVLYCTKLLNYFPPKNSISDTISPRTLLTGSTLNYKKDFSLPFGAYCQVHEDAAPRNSMIARTKAAICLGPTQNLQGGHHFMALDTGRVISRYSWT